MDWTDGSAGRVQVVHSMSKFWLNTLPHAMQRRQNQLNSTDLKSKFKSKSKSKSKSRSKSKSKHKHKHTSLYYQMKPPEEDLLNILGEACLYASIAMGYSCWKDAPFGYQDFIVRASIYKVKKRCMDWYILRKGQTKIGLFCNFRYIINILSIITTTVKMCD